MTTTNHTKFLKHLNESQQGVRFVSDWLLGLGYEVSQSPSTQAEEAKDWKKHVDSGDLFIKQRVEVKKLSYCFSESHWPHGKNFIVCAKHAFDNASPRPFMYVYVSDDESCVALVKSDTSSQWRVDSRTDSRYEGKVSQDCYFAPLECVSFVSVERKQV
jgi:hypothetical protein